MARNWYDKARSIAKRKGLTYRDIAECIDSSPAAVGHYLTGKRRVSDIQIIQDIAEVLDVPFLELLEEEADIVRNPVERGLLYEFRTLSPEQQLTVQDVCSGFYSANKK